MNLYLIGHECRYECEKICRIFYPAEDFVFVCSPADVPFTGGVYTKLEKKDGVTVFSAEVRLCGKQQKQSETVPSAECPDIGSEEKYLARCIVKCLSEITGIVPPWGILTGVRPSKLMLREIEANGQENAEKLFSGLLMVRPDKIKLASDVALAEKKCIDLSQSNSYSVYVSIPFCPTRCSYCSFVSHSIASAKKLIPDYVRLLCREIEHTAAIAKEAGLKLETVYMGGGTPTSLDAEDLEKITSALNRHFDAKSCREFTVEAGRPDTITAEKLKVLKNAGVGRISINPQTFSDEVLQNIGRKHTAADILEKFALARSLGFDNINMDFIAGLPGDSPAGFRQSIEKALELRPENITVHTLALKKAAEIVTEDETQTVCRETEEMLSFASESLGRAGYMPYYMYRQSKSVGNLENVGYCLSGTECLYNIYMMEEIHSIMAVGGGAVTKLVNPADRQIERIYNFKYPYEYISRFDELISRKDAMIIPGGEG